MQLIKDILIVLLAIILIIGGTVSLLFIVLASAYGIGYSVGWLLHFIIGPDIILGMTFEQFFGILLIVTSLISGSVFSVNQSKKISTKNDLTKEIKEYRGY